MDFAIGIDLGTSTSEICVYRKGELLPIPDPGTKSPIVPSLVAVNERGEPRVGEVARSMVDKAGHGIREVKRLMGSGRLVRLLDKEYRPEEISALILRRLKDNAEEALGSSIREVVLSVPANFPDAARRATLEAGELAGLKILRLINEPTAAALAYGVRSLGAEEQLAIFDFGGGTLDITILEMFEGILDVKCSHGDKELGGKDIDQLLINFMIQEFKKRYPTAEIPEQSLRDSKEVAEKAKIHLSAQNSVEVRLSNFGFLNNKMLDLEIEITRTQFDQMIQPLLDRTKLLIKETLRAKKINIAAVDKVLLVGGTTYVPAIRQLVADFFRKEPRKSDINPDLAVSLGAALQAGLATKQVDDSLIIQDVVPFGLGIPLVKQTGNQIILAYEPLIQRNTTFPYSVKREYSLLHPDQREVEISLFQDHTGNAQLPEDAEETGISGIITGIPPALYGTPHPIVVDFSYDINGMVTLHASIPGTGKEVEISYQPSPKRMDDSDRRQAMARVQDLWRRSPLFKDYEGLIAKADRILESIPEQEGAPLSIVLKELKESLASGETATIETAGNRLTDLLFEIENGF